MKTTNVQNIQALKELIFNEYVKNIDLAFTLSGADSYPVLQDVITKEVYVKHTDNYYYVYDSIEECKQAYKELGYMISYDMVSGKAA